MIIIETDTESLTFAPSTRARFLNDAMQAVDSGPLSAAGMHELVAVETESGLVVGRVIQKELSRASH